MMAGSLDANVILRLLLNDVPAQHAAALALLSTGDSFAVSDTAMIETIFVLGRAYELSRAQQREAVVGVLGQPNIAGGLELFETAFELYLAHPKLSFEDCYLVSVAEQTGRGPLWTFDKKLASQTDARLVEPA
jgi:predicted nucleic acid-binding protein